MELLPGISKLCPARMGKARLGPDPMPSSVGLQDTAVTCPLHTHEPRPLLPPWERRCRRGNTSTQQIQPTSPARARHGAWERQLQGPAPVKTSRAPFHPLHSVGSVVPQRPGDGGGVQAAANEDEPRPFLTQMCWEHFTGFPPQTGF